MAQLQGENGVLVLSRKTSERILIGDDIAITVVRIGPNSVRIGIEAPKTMNIVREELCDFSGRGTSVVATDAVVAPTT
ncbi:MAG: carbon storage regulator [Planctomycetaceae bacterium]